jgi:hypothetical protein
MRDRLVIGIKGAGEMASATAWTLYSAGFTSIFMMETANPEAVRRNVSFSEAVYEGDHTILGVAGRRADSFSTIPISTHPRAASGSGRESIRARSETQPSHGSAPGRSR